MEKVLETEVLVNEAADVVMDCPFKKPGVKIGFVLFAVAAGVYVAPKIIRFGKKLVAGGKAKKVAKRETKNEVTDNVSVVEK